MLFDKDSAFTAAAEGMDKFLQDWQKESVVDDNQHKSTQDSGNLERNPKLSGPNRDQAIFYLTEASFALERLESYAPAEMVEELQHVEYFLHAARNELER